MTEDRRYGYTVATTLRATELDKLKAIANKHNVTVSAYIRAIIVDALAEEESIREPL